MPELETVACNLCASAESRVLYERAYLLTSMSDGCAATTDEFRDYGRIVRCSRCGLAFTNPRPTQEELIKGYGSCVDETYLSESSSRSINAHLSMNVIKRFASGGKLLEVGASTGYFLNAARVDFDVTGIEPSAWASRIARERFKLDVRCEPFETCDLKKGSFDVVAAIDVIEHLTDPRAFLKRARELVKPGGVLYLVTPDIGSLSAKLMRGYWWGLRPAHIYYFDVRTITRLLQEEGFEILLAKSFGRIFSYDYWVTRLRNYPALLFKGVRGSVEKLGLGDKLVYIDTRDTMELCARRK